MALFLVARQDRYLVGGKRLAVRFPERDTPDEARTLKPGTVDRKG